MWLTNWHDLSNTGFMDLLITVTLTGAGVRYLIVDPLKLVWAKGILQGASQKGPEIRASGLVFNVGPQHPTTRQGPLAVIHASSMSKPPALITAHSASVKGALLIEDRVRESSPSKSVRWSPLDLRLPGKVMVRDMSHIYPEMGPSSWEHKSLRWGLTKFSLEEERVTLIIGGTRDRRSRTLWMVAF